jgi:ABC-2 type transport system permease protein
MSGGSVAPLAAVRLVYGLILRQLVTRGRLVALLLVGVVVGAVAAAVGSSDSVDDPLEAAVRVIADLGFITLVPVVALVFASAALGDARDDGTLVYLWLRPMDRWPVVLGAWMASVTVSLPLTIVPLGIAAVLVDGGGTLVSATVLASVVGVIAYSALFVLFGLLFRNSIVWGLGYVLVWEGIVAAFGSFAAKLAVRGYTRSIITARTGVDLDLGDLSLGVAVAVPLIAAVVALVAASFRLRSMEVA